MKTLLFTFTFLVLISCSEGDKKVSAKSKILKDETSITQVKKNAMESRYRLFTYANNSELETKIRQAVIDITNATRYEMDHNPANITTISSDVVIADGAGLLPEWRYYDAHGNLIDKYVYNITTGNYDSSRPTGVILPQCPAGSDYIGLCSYGSDFDACVGGYTAGYAISGVAQNKTVTETVTNGLTAATICGKKR